jgi:UDP-N-acetylmuramate--alanine ligase
VSLAVPGAHQVINAMAAAVLAAEQGVPAAGFAAGLANFAGLRRRLEYRGEVKGVAVVDDYAHHPTELAAACQAVRAMFPGQRLVVVFQPHQASRTARLLDEFAHCLQNADRAYICDIYRAREGLPTPHEKTASDLAAAARALGGEVSCLAVSELHNLALSLTSDHVLLTAGAGDIGKWTDELVRRFGSDCQNK